MVETRPTPYKAAYARRARALCANGLTDRELAAAFGVARATILRWRAERPDFAAATALANHVANERVERALYERATGYEEEAVSVVLPEGASAPVIVRYLREVRADVRAAFQWLRARDPHVWACTGPPEEDGIVDRLRKAMIRLGDRAIPYVPD